MGTIDLSKEIYSVGVLNPALRIFDIIMHAEYGTSYNAYLIKGEKTVLIDTVHEGFYDEYRENLESLISLSEIDYLVMNHTEPDHSGSIRKLLEINPDLVIYCTAPAKKYISEIANTPFQCKVVKAGDTLDLGGGRLLEFVPAPFLHWPDSMFTFDRATGTAFTCDFLGTHYCEPRMLDKFIHYREKYEGAFRYYYDCIFGPFKPHVLSGLDKLAALNPSAVCPSHGPVLTDSIGWAMDCYREWSQPLPAGKTVVIPYASAYGYTAELGEIAAAALRGKGYDVKLIDIVTTPLEESANAVAECDALLVGSNTINRDATKVVWDLLASIDAINTGKPAGAFGSYGWSGEAVGMIKSRLESLRFKFVEDGVRVQFRPTKDDYEKIALYALQVASLIPDPEK